MKTLFLSWDRLGGSMAGSAIRSLELARALTRQGLDVRIAAPAGSTLPTGVDLELIHFENGAAPAHAVAAADSVFVPGRVELMNAIRKPMAIDLYDPFVLSNLDFFGADFNRGGGRALLALRWLQHHLVNGDFFLCASETQRHFWLGMLAAAGRLNRLNYEDDPLLEKLMAIVPFGLSARRPEAQGAVLRGVVPGINASDRLILWAGGMWNWVDPVTLIHAGAKLRESRPEVKIVLLGASHPNPDIGEMRVAREAKELAQELDPKGETFFFLDWVPYDRRHLYLMESDVGVSLHRPGVESEFAFRTRLLDYLWCDLPMVLTEGDELATTIGAAGLGITVSAGDAAGVAAAIERIIESPKTVARQEAFREQQARLSWDRIAEPLIEFCQEPRRAPDRESNAWVAGISRGDAPRKEAALIADEFKGTARSVSSPLGADHHCRQKFEAAFDGLAQVDVLLGRSGVRQDGNLIFELRQDGGLVARVLTTVGELTEEGWQRFEFRPIPNARGREFEFSIRLVAHAGELLGEHVWVQHTNYERDDAGPGCQPAFIARYLIDGVASETGVPEDEFLFLHNTSLPLLPGDALSETRDYFGAGESPAIEGVQAAVAEISQRAARAEDRVAALEDRLASVAQHRAHIEVRYRGLLFPIYYELLRVLRLGTHALRTGVYGIFVVLLVLLGIPLAVLVGTGLLLVDILSRRVSRPIADLSDESTEQLTRPTIESRDPVSVVIPTWNGQELLAMSLPPLAAAIGEHGHPDDEVLVVDNASEDDSLAYLESLRDEMPFLRVIRMERNEGFAGATNEGARQARNPVLLLLNNDMVVEPDFIQPLLDAFAEEPGAFGVSSQIDFIDPGKPRWETGKVHAEFERGCVKLFHLDRFEEDLHYPIFFAGGGASAYDRSRFLELGGFDEEVFSPVYIEDVDLGYRAWRRGWPSVLAPASRVHHKHRGTTRRRWSEATIHSFFVKNLAALVWKNMSSWRILLPHLAGLTILPTRILAEIGPQAAFAAVRGLYRQVPAVMRARMRENAVARPLSDNEVFSLSRSRAAYRGRFHPKAAGARPQVLVISPYSPVPAVHGGAVRISNLLREMGKRADVTLLSFADTEAETAPDSLAELSNLCRESLIVPRDTSSARGSWLAPTKLRGFHSARLSEEIRECMERRSFDVVQVEYTHMAHFLPPPTPGVLRVLVEHDVSFVALDRARRLPGSLLRKVGLWVDGLRTFRQEILAVESADRVIMMSENDRDVLAKFLPSENLQVVPNGVDCTAFPFGAAPEGPPIILFVGFFRHEPNVEAALYFAREVLPRIHQTMPEARFRIVGAYPPPAVLDLPEEDHRIEVTGWVDSTALEYQRASVFVAPVLRGSGTRLKILEAMASGAAVVSTTIGAEGILADSGEIRVANDPAQFAQAVVETLENPESRDVQVQAARRLVESRYDWSAIGESLFEAYGWGGRSE
jgi:glycosyltransferase involved in cell wall biosynthesis/GT2 family glycosyltransferase